MIKIETSPGDFVYFDVIKLSLVAACAVYDTQYIGDVKPIKNTIDERTEFLKDRRETYERLGL